MLMDLLLLAGGVLLGSVLLLLIQRADQTRVDRFADKLNLVALHIHSRRRRLLLKERVGLRVHINVERLGLLF